MNFIPQKILSLLKFKRMDRLDIIKSALGKPFHESDNGLIYNCDCVDALYNLHNRSIIDCTITSPPYNIGKEYETVTHYDKYVAWLTSILSSVENITKPNGALLLNVGYLSIQDKGRAIPIPYLLWDKIQMYLQQEIVWNYGAGVACKNYLSPRNEKILWYVKDPNLYTFNLDDIRDPNVLYPNQKKNGKLRCNSIGKNPSDVWQIAKVTSGRNRASDERTLHPAQFPEDLIRRIIRGFSNVDDLILDPFMGSGTVASVCIEEGRKYLGFEISEKYCEVIATRLDLKLSNPKLF